MLDFVISTRAISQEETALTFTVCAQFILLNPLSALGLSEMFINFNIQDSKNWDFGGDSWMHYDILSRM